MRILHNRIRSRQRGTALLELALATPLFLAVIYGLFSITLLIRAQYQVAVVAHAIMREVAAGDVNAYTLSEKARAYAHEIGMDQDARFVVDTGTAEAGGVSGLDGFGEKLGLGVRVNVSGIVPVGGLLKTVWPSGVLFRCSTVCLPDSWKSPFAFLKAFIVIPEML